MDTQARGLVVVANRLPVHRVDDGQGGTRWDPSPGGLVAALGAACWPTAPGAWVGFSGCAERGLDGLPDAVGAHPAAQRAARRGPLPRLLRGLQQLDAVAALPRRRAAPGVPPRVVGRVRRRQPRATPRRAPRWPTPAPSVWVHDYQLQLVPDDAARAAPRRAASASSCTSRFRPQELFMQLPWRRAGRRGAAWAPTSSASRCPSQRRTSSAWPSAWSGRAATVAPLYAGQRALQVGVVPDLHRHAVDRGGAPATPRCGPGRRRCARSSGSPKAVLLGVDRLDYTKGIDLRLRAVEELFRDGDPRGARPRDAPGRRAVPPGRGDLRRRAGARSSAGSARSTATSARSATRPSTTCTARCRSRSSSPCTWRPT